MNHWLAQLARLHRSLLHPWRAPLVTSAPPPPPTTTRDATAPRRHERSHRERLEPVRPWWEVLEFEAGPPRSLAIVEARFRQLAARIHPDRGGSSERMQRLYRARAQARSQYPPGR